MSLQHTPPQHNLLRSESTFSTPMDYPSDAEVGHEAGMSDSSCKATKTIKKSFRVTKRKQGDREDISRAEFLEMFKALKIEQDLKLDTIINSVNGLTASVGSLTTKIEEQSKTIKILQEDNTANKIEIFTLKNQVETLQHMLCGSSLEIRNIPTAQKESKEDLKKIVCSTADYLKISLTKASIKDVYRRNTKSESKPIVADFTTAAVRDEILASFKKLNKDRKEDKFCTTHINLEGPTKPIYLSENLTPNERKLFRLARVFAKENNFAFCWTSYGRIFLRKTEGSPQLRISSENDLDKLKSQ